MNKTLLITGHEFLGTVKRKGFIILTLILPVLALLGIGVIRIVSGVAAPPAEITKIGYVDETGSFTKFTDQASVIFVNYESPAAARQAMVSQDIKEYFIIPADFITNGVVSRYSMQKEVTAPETTIAVMKNFITSNILTGKVTEPEIKIIESPLYVTTTILTASGDVAPEQGGLSNLLIPGVFGILLALALSFSSAYVIQGLGEEKENRLMEILLSSVNTRQLITGKVLGIGAAGLAQVVVWIICLPLLLNVASSSIGGFLSTITIPPGFLLLGIVYFVLGYLLFAVLSACVAAISPTAREAQSLAAIFTLFSVAPFWFFSLLMFFPNSPVWVVFSIFPFSAPVLVMLRIGMVGVPAWQIAASLGVLVLSIVGGLLLASRLLRTYLLMYGKRPGFGEIMRNLRHS